MKIRFLWPGKTQNKQLKILQDNYLAKINRFHQTEIVEFKEINSKQEKEKKEYEEKEFLKRLSTKDNVIMLTEKGKQFDSYKFSSFIEKSMIYDSRNITFLVGGEWGFSKEMEKQGFEQLSLSKLTFTHEFARVLLLEQVYRAFTIIKNIKYQR
jgi:23S rRNA (pseudouridine1915-N3)-methyltransferase